MFRSKSNDAQEGLDELIDAVQDRLLQMEPDSEEFSKTVDQLDKLHKIKSDNTDEPRVTLGQLLPVLGNLLGIVLILGYENAHVITSKALAFVAKTRL